MADESPTRAVESESMSSVYRFAIELVDETRRANEARLADARDLATMVSIADASAAERIVEATEEANRRDLEVAERQGEELVNFARSGILSAVQRYATGLIEEQRRIAENRMPRAKQLAELIRGADPDAAERMLQAIEEVHKSSLESAEQQAKAVIDLARSRLEKAELSSATESGAEAEKPEPVAWAPPEAHERPGAPPATHITRSFQEAFQRGQAAGAESSPVREQGDGGSAGEEC